MPAKVDTNSPENVALVAQFTALGLAPNSATELVKQPKSGLALKGLIEEYHLNDVQLEEKQAGALVKLATGGAKLGPAEKGFVVQKVVKGNVKSVDQVAGESAAYPAGADSADRI